MKKKKRYYIANLIRNKLKRMFEIGNDKLNMTKTIMLFTKGDKIKKEKKAH
jgi:hypothetical protein